MPVNRTTVVKHLWSVVRTQVNTDHVWFVPFFSPSSTIRHSHVRLQRRHPLWVAPFPYAWPTPKPDGTTQFCALRYNAKVNSSAIINRPEWVHPTPLRFCPLKRSLLLNDELDQFNHAVPFYYLRCSISMFSNTPTRGSNTAPTHAVTTSFLKTLNRRDCLRYVTSSALWLLQSIVVSVKFLVATNFHA
jgi:hypothetical protein